MGALSTEMSSEDVQHLLNLLDNIAAYNDKGHIWSRHSEEEIDSRRREAQADIERLVARIGPGAFSTDLLHKLESGDASRDGSGEIYFQAKRELQARGEAGAAGAT